MKRKRSDLLVPAVVVVILCLAVTAFLGRSRKTETTSDNAAVISEGESLTIPVKVLSEGESLTIPVSEVTEEASFFPIEVDGTQMEVIAVRDGDGVVRTAFNTCQICYGSGRGYYVQQGDAFICQNCGNRFTVDQVEVESGGCNPWPIFEEDKIVTDESIEISYDFLLASKEIFSNWKKVY